MKYKIIVSYDGAEYSGWQAQKEAPSIAQTLQDTFKLIFDKEIFLRGASRTDAGVHALGQVAVFDAELEINTVTMMRAWNDRLPSDIVIRSLVPAPNFNPYVSVVSKTYWYHFFIERPLPFAQRYGWYVKKPINFAKLEESLKIFLGEHDFRSFCTGDERGEDTIRRIDQAWVEYITAYNVYRISIVGPKFLHYMIRRIVGACIEIASRDNLTIDDIKRVLQAKNPEHHLPNAPAKGLMLYKIIYEGQHE